MTRQDLLVSLVESYGIIFGPLSSMWPILNKD